MKFIMTGQYSRMIWLSCVAVCLSQSFIVILAMKPAAKPAVKPPVVAVKPPVVAAKPPVVPAKPPVVAAKPAVPVVAKPAVPTATSSTATKPPVASSAGTKPATSGATTASKPGDPTKPATPVAAKPATPVASSTATKPATPTTPAAAAPAKPSMFSGLASKASEAASMAGGMASNPMAAGAAGIGAPAPVEAPVVDAPIDVPVEAPVDVPAVAVDAPLDPPVAPVDDPVADAPVDVPVVATIKTAVKAVSVAKPVVSEAVESVAAPDSDEGTDAVVKPPVIALATKKPAVAPIKTAVKVAVHATAPKPTTATGLFIQGLMATLEDKSVDFNAETLMVQFAVGTVKCEASIKFGFVGFGDPDKPFEEATVKLEASVPDAVKKELAPLLALKPAEVFVLKLILMLNSANKAAAVDAAKEFDVDDMILINLPMLLHRLEQTDKNAYATSSQAAFDDLRQAFKPLLELVKFPENHWYERAVTDMPDGKPTEFMRQISKMRWQSGFKARTKALESQILPLLTAERNPLEKAFFAYAITMHLQEYDGGFIDTDKPDYVKPIIDSRIEMLKPVLQKAIDAMGVAKMDAAGIKKAQDFLAHSDDKSRAAGGKADALVPLRIPAVAVPGLKAGVDYFISIVDRFMRHHIIHPKLLGDADCIPFDFAFDRDSLLESLVSLNMRMVKGSAPKVLSQMLADIYFRASDESVDTMIRRMAAINGLLHPAVQPAVDVAKKGAADDEEFEDDIVMDIEDLPAAAAAA